MTKHYEVEYTIQGSFIDTVYDVDSEQEAVDKAVYDLRDRPPVITKDDVKFTSVVEVDYESGLKKENTMIGKSVLITGSEATLKVDAETGFIWEKQSHNHQPCEIKHHPLRRGDSCSCFYMGDTALNNAYADIRRFNLNDRTRDFTAGEIDILYIGYERWDGTYERPLTEFNHIDTDGYISRKEE